MTENIPVIESSAVVDWKDFFRLLRTHLLQACFTVILAGILTFGVLEVDWHTRRKRWQILFSLLVGIFCEGVVHTFITEQHQKEQLRSSLESIEYDAHRSRDLERKLSKVTHIVDRYTEYFGGQVPDLSQEWNEYIQFIQRRHLEITSKLSELLASGRVDASYRDQLDFAAVFAHSARKYFWATSLDKISEFQKRNYYYLETLKTLPSRMSTAQEKQLPQVARIFVGRLQDFYEDILNEYPKALDLYDWHIRWLGRTPHGYPLKFYAYNSHTEYADFFARASIPEDKRIEDFMIVDGMFIYGRRPPHGGELVQLASIRDEAFAHSYEDMYPRLWEASLSIESFVQKMMDELVVDPEHLNSFLQLCHKLESKLEIEKDYVSKFSIGEQKGNSFFNRCCQLISEGTGECFALDRADKKGGDLIETWGQPPYEAFKDASVKAAQHGAQFKRLFIIQDLLSNNLQEISDFIFEFVSTGIQVGFILVTVTGLAPLIERYDTDFIVVGINDRNFVNLDSAFGFELQETDFDVKNLSWDKNLIAKSRLNRHHTVFEQLWARAEVVKVTNDNPNAIGQAAIRLRKESAQ